MGATVNTGDCLAWLRSMPDNSVDSIVTDPPYGLSNIKPARITEAITAWAAGDRESVPDGRGFMGKAWDSFVPPPAVWDECLRVLKPGGHLVAFAGSRTHDLMGLSIRMAGFEIRDGLAWLYSQGFPKSLDVSKAIDKSGGVSPVESSLVLRAARERSGMSREDVAAAVGCTASSVRDWEDGRARATGSAVEYITPSPAYRDKLAELLGYTDDERIITGSTIRRIGDGTVMALGHSGAVYSSKPVTPKAAEWSGWGTALKPAFEPITLARKPLEGNVAANVLKWGTGALNIDGTRITTSQDGVGNSRGGSTYCTCHAPEGGQTTRTASTQRQASSDASHGGHSGPQPSACADGPHCPQSQDSRGDCQFSPCSCGGRAQLAGGDDRASSRRPLDVPEPDARQLVGIRTQQNQSKPCPYHTARNVEKGRWPANVVLDEHQAAALDDQSAEASRFFYCAKASRKERPEVDGVSHPTVKPLSLMRWLVRLVTPPGGLIADPFAGSGSTIEAAMLEGFDVTGCEREPRYITLIKQRIERASNSPSFNI